MLSFPIKQKVFKDVKDWNEFWEGAVSDFVEERFKTPEFFIKEYKKDYESVVRRVAEMMGVVPIDIKYSITSFYNALIEESKKGESKTEETE